MSVQIPDKIKEMFPDIKLYSSEDVKSMTPSELERYLKKLQEAEDDLKYKEAQSTAKLESIQKEREFTLSKIREEFGVDTLEELEKLKEKQLGKIDSLLEDLKDSLSKVEA